MTRCKPGDLALVVKDDHGSPNVGKMVTCIAIERTTDRHGPIWRIDRDLEWSEGPRPFFPDAYLMPVRPEPDDIDEPANNELEHIK